MDVGSGVGIGVGVGEGVGEGVGVGVASGVGAGVGMVAVDGVFFIAPLLQTNLLFFLMQVKVLF